MSIRAARRDRTVRVRTLSRSGGCGKYVDETRAYEKSVPYARQLRLTCFANRNIGAVLVTRIITRVTCAAVTSGTPSWSTFAVTHISAMPPGAVASTIVEIGTAPRTARPQAHSADLSIASTTERQTMPIKRDEVRKDSRSNPAPSEHPIRSCAALDSQVGIAERLTSPKVRATVTPSGPSIQAFGMPTLARAPPTSAAAPSNAIRPRATTANCAGR